MDIFSHLRANSDELFGELSTQTAAATLTGLAPVTSTPAIAIATVTGIATSLTDAVNIGAGDS